MQQFFQGLVPLGFFLGFHLHDFGHERNIDRTGPHRIQDFLPDVGYPARYLAGAVLQLRQFGFQAFNIRFLRVAGRAGSVFLLIELLLKCLRGLPGRPGLGNVGLGYTRVGVGHQL